MEFKNKKTGFYEPVQGDNGAADVNVLNIAGSDSIQPVDIQARYAQTIQTHNAVSVAAGGSSTSAWVDSNGFEKLKLTALNDASTSTSGELQWSNDGATIHGIDGIPSSTSMYRTYEKETQARYFRIKMQNHDTVAHTMSAWTYLKA